MWFNRDKENSLVVAEVEGAGGWMEWEVRVRRWKFLYIGWINNKVLLYSTGNYIQYQQCKRTLKSAYITESLCYTAIFNAALHSNYTSIIKMWFKSQKDKDKKKFRNILLIGLRSEKSHLPMDCLLSKSQMQGHLQFYASHSNVPQTYWISPITSSAYLKKKNICQKCILELPNKKV